MAMSQSPQLSPVMGASHRVDRHHSNSPPQQQLSKRDKKRTLLADRLAEITSQFSSNRDAHYREQLQALQIDMNLIMDADAHGNSPLPSMPYQVDGLVQDNIKRTMMKSIGPNPPPRAGKVYMDFAREVNDAMEERDAALTLHDRDFNVKLSELKAEHAFRLKLAASEHKALSTTLRDRLINSVTNKKNRLSRDKETMEIGESNALLLHPSQYGIANPASPGGIHGKRATRHRREADELPTFSEGSKRKRKGAESDESPAPTRPRLDNGSSTPLWFAEKQNLTTQQVDSPLYSIDKLFTDKELAMTYNVAALAAHTHMQRHPPFSDVTDSPPNGKSEDSSERGALDPDNEDDDSLPGGTSMERQYSHATRSTRGGALANYSTGLGIDALDDLNFPGNFQAITRQIPKMPNILAITTQKVLGKGEASSAPAALSADDAAAEIDMIRRARAYNDAKGLGSNLDVDGGGHELLQAVTEPRTYKYWLKADVMRQDQDYMEGGGEMMDKQRSRDTSEMHMGGVSMSRVPTGDGTTSSRGRRIKPIGKEG
ncbi:hypothetical protein LOCC1_G006462 [Lachnellula occidentalis]|uniref:Uncharacterized protein n=1 Tax=Lachnellula occidentalis TaxID=215460 RepID=A0A8H8S3I8_9HELO|nr:hypothetical protein LOCC1_G006462 [Lachnellula occidentalis]